MVLLPFSSPIKCISNNINRGAMLAYRVAQWHPELVTHLFTVCVPYAAPSTSYIPLETLVKSVTPHFGYQLQFASGEVEKVVKTKGDIKGFLSALYGGRTENGETGFDEKKGVLLDRLGRLRRSKLKNDEVFPSPIMVVE